MSPVEARDNTAVTYDSSFRGSMTKKKTDWTNTYTHTDPSLYIDALGPLDYGHFQNRFLEVIVPEMENFTRQTGGRPLRAVEFGALYGNSTLAYKYGMDWDKTVAVWRDPKAPLTPRFNVHVTASDISVPALEYGLKRGIYDAVHAHDFNKVLPRDLTDAVMDADVMFCLMSTNYLKLIQWQRMCLQFLGDRSKPKLLCWNVVCAFDQRNLTPEVLFSALKNWTATSHFIKHRNFSDEERAAHGGCRESWTMMYVVRFEAENAQI